MVTSYKYDVEHESPEKVLQLSLLLVSRGCGFLCLLFTPLMTLLCPHDLIHGEANVAQDVFTRLPSFLHHCDLLLTSNKCS